VVGQAQLDGLLAVPEQAREGLGRFLQTRAAAFLDHGDELAVDLVDHGLASWVCFSLVWG
jgi:hypothetical protein